MAQSGAFGTSPSMAVIADYFVDAVQSKSLSPYVGTIKRAGIEGVYPEVAIQGDFDGDSQLDTLYTNPYYDCGKGRIIEILDNDAATEWSRDSSGVLGTATCGDRLGASVAIADFDGDGYDDVVTCHSRKHSIVQ